jgi:hypothetical protein
VPADSNDLNKNGLPIGGMIGILVVGVMVIGIIIQRVIVSDQSKRKRKENDESGEFDSTDDLLKVDLNDWNELSASKGRSAKPK